MAQEKTRPPKSNSYNIFILVLTVLSLLVMVVMLMPLAPETLKLLSFYDNLICVIFLIDFFSTLFATPKKSDYFIKQRGWLDLIGSIPSLGIAQFGAILRLARLSRFARIARLMRGENKKALIKDVLSNRSQYALFITILMTLTVLTVSSVLVLEFETASPDSNIKSGGDAFWYAIVTLTTVGYGDRYPVTAAGRSTAMFIMMMGVGVIGALASILASLLVGGAPPPAEEATTTPMAGSEVDALKRELGELRQLLEKIASTVGTKT